MRIDRTRTEAAKARTVRLRNDRRRVSALRLMIFLDERAPLGAR